MLSLFSLLHVGKEEEEEGLIFSINRMDIISALIALPLMET
jgi:hypothetical protein